MGRASDRPAHQRRRRRFGSRCPFRGIGSGAIGEASCAVAVPGAAPSSFAFVAAITVVFVSSHTTITATASPRAVPGELHAIGPVQIALMHERSAGSLITPRPDAASRDTTRHAYSASSRKSDRGMMAARGRPSVVRRSGLSSIPGWQHGVTRATSSALLVPAADAADRGRRSRLRPRRQGRPTPGACLENSRPARGSKTASTLRR